MGGHHSPFIPIRQKRQNFGENDHFAGGKNYQNQSQPSTWRTLKNKHYHPRLPHQRFILTTLLPSENGMTSKTFYIQHLITQQPIIRFTMETENGNTIPFLDTLVIKDSEGRLTLQVFIKNLHTDQYLSYDTPHSISLTMCCQALIRCIEKYHH